MRFLKGLILSMIKLPFPDKVLNPNARVHWAKKHKASKKARESAYWATKEAKTKAPESELIRFVVRFYPPDNRRRDDDNLEGAFKPMRDGIADALRINDSRFMVDKKIMPKGEFVGVTVELFEA